MIRDSLAWREIKQRQIDSDAEMARAIGVSMVTELEGPADDSQETPDFDVMAWEFRDQA